MMLTVLIAHRKAVVRRQIRRAFERQRLTEVVAECAAAAECALSLRVLRPGLAILSDEIAREACVTESARHAERSTTIVVVLPPRQSHWLGGRCDGTPHRAQFDADQVRRWLHALGAVSPTPVSPPGVPVAPAGRMLRVPTRAYGPRVSVSSTECIWIESAGNSVRIHTASRTLLLREKLHAIERHLGAESFARVSRRALVNIRCIERVTPSRAGGHGVRLVDGTEVTMSPTFAQRVIAAIESRRRDPATGGSDQPVPAARSAR